jgi:hypothetical protein
MSLLFPCCMDLYHLRQGLHVIAAFWDYHDGAESRVSIWGISVRFNRGVLGALVLRCTVVLAEGGYKRSGRGSWSSRSQRYWLRQVPISWWRRKACKLTSSVVPPRLGDCLSFYRPRRKQFTSVPHYSDYVWRHDVQCHGVDDCLGESCSCWGVVASPVPVQERLRGWWRGGCSSGRCPRADSRVPSTGGRTRHSSGRGDVLSPCALIASGMVLQCPEWRCSGVAVVGMAAQGW